MGLFSKRPSAIPTDLAAWPDSFNSQLIESTTILSERMNRCMPAEWFPQTMVQLTWPHKDTDWAPYLDEVTDCYIRIAYEITLTERLLIVHPDTEALSKVLRERLPQKSLEKIALFQCPINDTWARDHAFLTVFDEGEYRLLDFGFNGWGGKFEATKDNAINHRLYDAAQKGEIHSLDANTPAPALLRGIYEDHLDFILEGGSIESDGQGTLLTTSRCLLSKGRNPQFTKSDLETQLLSRLRSRRVLWLDHGYLEGDDTDSHIDTLARLCPNNTIVYVSCEDKDDPHYQELKLMEQQLHTFHTMRLTPYRLLALPMAPVLYDKEKQRLPSTYANYLVINGRVLMPSYGDAVRDTMAANVIQKAFPSHSITMIPCNVLLLQHGSLHCSTMQYYC